MRRTERKQRGHLCQLCFFYGLHRASAHNRGIFNAEVVQGLQVRDVREGGVSQTGKPLKRAEVVYGLQVKGVREGGVSLQPKYSKSAEVVQGLQVRDVREGGRQPNGKALKKSRDCTWLTGKMRERRRATAAQEST